jgi:nucleoside-diphosphate-sugar epimerase
VAALHAHGHEVVTLSRSGGDVRADVMDRDGLLRALDGVGVEAVVHQATAFRELGVSHRGMRRSNELRVDGTRNLIDAARACGARRFVAQSMIFGYGYGDHGDHVLTEADPFAPHGRTRALERHLSAMRALEEQTLGADGLEGIALRYGLFYGRDVNVTKMLDALRKRQLPVPKRGGVVSFVYLDDAAAATVAALERGRAGEAYNVVDDEPASWRDFLSALAEAFGARPPRELPTWLIGRIGYLGAFMTSVVRVSNAKARQELGFAPTAPTYRDGIALLAEAASASERP